MNNRNALQLHDMTGAEADALKQSIELELMPEFEWCGNWIAAFSVITTAKHRNHTKYFLQDFLVSICGASVPRVVPVRLRKGGTPLLRQVFDLYAHHYPEIREVKDEPKRKKVKA